MACGRMAVVSRTDSRTSRADLPPRRQLPFRAESYTKSEGREVARACVCCGEVPPPTRLEHSRLIHRPKSPHLAFPQRELGLGWIPTQIAVGRLSDRRLNPPRRSWSSLWVCQWAPIIPRIGDPAGPRHRTSRPGPREASSRAVFVCGTHDPSILAVTRHRSGRHRRMCVDRGPSSSPHRAARPRDCAIPRRGRAQAAAARIRSAGERGGPLAAVEP